MEDKFLTMKMDDRLEKSLKVLMDSGRYATIGEAILCAVGNMAFMEEFKKKGDKVEVIKTDSFKKSIRLQMK